MLRKWNQTTHKEYFKNIVWSCRRGYCKTIICINSVLLKTLPILHVGLIQKSFFFWTSTLSSSWITIIIILICNSPTASTFILAYKQHYWKLALKTHRKTGSRESPQLWKVKCSKLCRRGSDWMFVGFRVFRHYKHGIRAGFLILYTLILRPFQYCQIQS